MSEDEIFQSFCKWMLCKNPGIAASMKMRQFIEGWITYKIDMLPMLSALGDKMDAEFADLMHRNFENKQD